MESYDVIKTIGKGASGTVLLATEKKSSRYTLFFFYKNV